MLLLVSGATRTVERLKNSPCLGHLLSPRSRNDPAWFVQTGLPWAADNGAFAGFDEAAYLKMLDRIQDVLGCLFVTAPDVVGDAATTLSLFRQWHPILAERSLPVAFVAQDGQESLPVPWDGLDALFLGGSTDWKLGQHAMALATEARARGKWLHMGRVNSNRRLALALSWRCDSVDGSGYSMFPDQKLPTAIQFIMNHPSHRAGRSRIET